MPARPFVSLPRLVIGAPQGRSGKTTVALGLCAALTRKGYSVQPFKKGPDYIDPSWLSEAAGRSCRTLDPFFLSTPEDLRQAFLRGASETNLSLIEGNHGLYDSSVSKLSDEEGRGSTAAVARLLHAPVILVVNAARMSRSAAAMVSGYQTFEPETDIAAVILNNVAHGRHEAKLREAIERHCQIPVIGALPREDALVIPDRHLGLVPRSEDEGLVPAIEACRLAAECHIDLEAVLSIAAASPPIEVTDSQWRTANRKAKSGAQSSQHADNRQPVTIGVIRDRAFSFYYPENLEALEEAGARLVFIDALHDSYLPEVNTLYIGGGFPEMFMERLSTNKRLREAIRDKIEAGLPVYAECGGLMYLSKRIVWGDRSAEMVGALPCEVEMTERPQGHGYVIAKSVGENPFLELGSVLRGHEFHHSRLIDLKGDMQVAYRLERGNGLGGKRDGLVYKNVLASYTHLHAYGSPAWASGLVARARVYAGEKIDG